MSRRILILALALAVILGAILYFSLSGRGVNVEIELPSEPILIGVPFELNVRFLNNSRSELRDVRIALSLPEGLGFWEDSQKVNVINSLGEVGLGGVVRTSFLLIPLPSDNPEAYGLTATATYAPGSLSAEFSERDEVKINVSRRNVDLEVQAPDTVAVGQEFQLVVNYKNLPDESTRDREMPSLLLQIEGPDDFSVIASEPPAVLQGAGWTLEEGEDRQLSVLGRVNIGDEEGTLLLQSRIALEFGGKKYILVEKETGIGLAPPPLFFDLSLAGDAGRVSPGDLLTYNVRYQNNTGADLRNVVIRVQLVGDMFDLKTIKTDGSFNELSRTAGWTSAEFKKLSLVRRGEDGAFSFSVRVRPNLQMENTDLTLRAKGTIESPTTTQGLGTEKTVSFDSEEIKVLGPTGDGAGGAPGYNEATGN